MVSDENFLEDLSIWQEKGVSIYIKIRCFSLHYLKKLKLLNHLRLFMDQFVHYIHRNVCSLSSV